MSLVQFQVTRNCILGLGKKVQPAWNSSQKEKIDFDLGFANNSSFSTILKRRRLVLLSSPIGRWAAGQTKLVFASWLVCPPAAHRRIGIITALVIQLSCIAFEKYSDPCFQFVHSFLKNIFQSRKQRLYPPQIIWVCPDIWVFSVLHHRHCQTSESFSKSVDLNEERAVKQSRTVPKVEGSGLALQTSRFYHIESFTLDHSP